jgi:hypothetical protein
MSALLGAWELPQNLLGAAVLGAAWATGQVLGVQRDKQRLFVRSKGLGVSLGWFVFYCDDGNRYFRDDPLMKRHEHGHTFQSRRLGPLYLPLVGVPSVSRVLYAMAYREATGRRWRGYYDGWPERQADELGGIRREERLAALAAER